MPTNPWKKSMAADALLSDLRSKRNVSFFVQTGFPTSLADLIVKNHGRLKKSSRNTKKKTRPSSNIPQFLAIQSRSIPPEFENPRSADQIEVFISGFQFLVVILILLVGLVIGNKKVVLGFMISAFVLLIFENWMFLRPCEKARKRFDSVIGGFDFGGREFVSPIGEIGVGICSDFSISDLKLDELRIKDKSIDLFGGICDSKKVCRKCKLGFFGDFKMKNLVRKFVGRICHSVEDTGEELCERKSLEEEEGDERIANCFDVLGEGDDSNINMDEDKSGKIYGFFLILIVLFGLLRGKAVALFLAIVWCFVYKFIIEVWSKNKMQ